MNPLTNMKNVTKLSEQELNSASKSSWHDQYRDSAWIFVGGLPYDLTEGDILCIFSQYGEVVNINLIRAKDTGKSKGFCFLCYEDQRSTILAVDNLNGIKILNRTIRVDHVQNYKVPKEGKKTSEETKKLYNEGCAPKSGISSMQIKVEPPSIRFSSENIRETLVDQIEQDIKLPTRLPIYTDVKREPLSDDKMEQSLEKEKPMEPKKKSKKRRDSSESDLPTLSESGESKRTKKEMKDKQTHKYGSSKEKDAKKTLSLKYSKTDNEDKQSDSRSSKDNRHNKTNEGNASDRSSFRDSDQPAKTYKRDVSPSIPKRWR